MPIITVEAPISEPVSIEEARSQCRIDADITGEDELLEHYIAAAREYCEIHTGRHFTVKTMRYIGPWQPEKIELSATLQAVNFVQYQDHENKPAALPDTDYYVDTVSLVGCLIPLAPWPSTYRTHPHPVIIEFEVGERDEQANSTCPAQIKQAILLLVAHWYGNREATGFTNLSKEVEFSVKCLLAPHRIINV